MNKIVVYLTEDYSKAEEFLLPLDYSKEQITQEVNNRYPIWYYYDIFKETLNLK
jgi:hypothetical protein